MTCKSQIKSSCLIYFEPSNKTPSLPLFFSPISHNLISKNPNFITKTQSSKKTINTKRRYLIYRPWSYHNAGSWPTLLWQLTVACIKMDRPEIAERAVKIAEKRLSKDKWPEYYDTKGARFIGKQSRLFQTWSIASYLVAKLLLAKPKTAKILINEEDLDLVNAFCGLLTASPRRKRPRK